jgi:hypothetical protein
MFAAVVEFGGNATLKMPDGSHLKISLHRKIDEPDPDKATAVARRAVGASEA